MADIAPGPGRLDLGAALAQATGRLATQPAAARVLALQVLKAAPGHPQALRVLGSALRRLGEVEAARQVLERLALDHPNWIPAHYELGVTLSALGEAEAAETAFRTATAMTPSPDMAPAWRALGEREMTEATEALGRKDFAAVRSLLEKRLDVRPRDVAALRLLAEAESLQRRYPQAEALLIRSLAITPDAPGLRHSLVDVLSKQVKMVEALAQIDEMLRIDPDDLQLQALRGGALSNLGDCDAALEIWERLLAKQPGVAKLWLRYGDTLKAAGRADACMAAYRRAIALSPGDGRAYWNLSNLKTVRFDGPEIDAMQAALGRPGASVDDRLLLHYALGKAFEDKGEFATAFAHYDDGARLQRARAPYDADETTDLVRRTREVFTAELFETRRGCGHTASDPIFAVGLPRSGSTLVEQILCSHPAVEGASELHDLGWIAGDLDVYPEAVAELDRDALAALGRRYLDTTSAHRKTNRPLFIDKMPRNFLLTGLIHLILPNAKIIDVRRHPMASGFSAFKQYFASGHRFSCSLDDVGRYYRDYVELMAHFDAALPGRVHRVRYEALVDDTEGEVRRLLAHCELPFEAGCLSFHQNARAVRTPSSEQVRRPIFRDGLDQWRNFEPWLNPLKAALGPALGDA